MQVSDEIHILSNRREASHTRVLNIPTLLPGIVPRLALGIILLIVYAAYPLHAQYTYTEKYDFGNCPLCGIDPIDYGRLTQGADGNLYGTASLGGAYGAGAIFVVTPAGGYTDLWDFDGLTGAGPGGYPNGALTLASDGNFYGTTGSGGTNDNGTVFRFTPPSTVTVLHAFDIGTSSGPPVQGKDGNLYGTYGIAASRKTYSIILPPGTYKALPKVGTGNSYGPMVLASDGNLYGTSCGDGKNGDGTIFRMIPPGGAIHVIHNFKGGIDGLCPWGPLIQASNGDLYGTTNNGGSNSAGEVFGMTLSGARTMTFSFDAIDNQYVNADGARPLTGLFAASDGYLYGVADLGGSNGNGTIFRISTAGAFEGLVVFPGPPQSGFLSTTALIQHTNGSLYGLQQLGTSGDGNFFSLTANNFNSIIAVEGPIFVKPGTPVEILGNNLTHVMQVTFGGVQTQFQPSRSDTALSATVPYGALDGAVTATFDTGLQNQTLSSLYILPVITSLDPLAGPAGALVTISGGGFTGATKVTFGGVAATNLTVLSPSRLQATVPPGAKTGKVAVTTSHDKATSQQRFTVR